MPIVTELGLAALGFFVGAAGTVVGAGGGFILVPTLLLLFPDYGPDTVTSMSLGMVWANAASGSIAYARHRRIDYVTGLLLAGSSVPGVVVGALAVGLFPERLFTAVFGVLLLSLAAFSVRRPQHAIRAPPTGPGRLVRRIPMPDGTSFRYSFKIWKAVLLSVGVGFISSLFGLGGGIMHVPAMVVFLHIPAHFAVATSQFILVFMAGGATVTHLANGTLAGEPLVRTLALAAGAIPGAQAGALLARRLQGRQVMLLLALALATLGFRLIAKGAFDL